MEPSSDDALMIELSSVAVFSTVELNDDIFWTNQNEKVYRNNPSFSDLLQKQY